MSRQGARLALLAVVGVAVHLGFVLGGDALDADRALVLLMARHFAEGEFSLYFWHQNYMASLEPLLLTPLALLGWATPVVSGLVGLALTTAITGVTVALARRLGGAPWAALLLWAVPPAVVVHHHVALYGARLAATLLVVVAFAAAVRRPGPRGWVGVGLLIGVAYMGDHLMLPWAAGLFWLAVVRGGTRPFLAGALPWVVADTALAVITPAAHLSGPNEPGDWLWNLVHLFGTTLPQLFGLLLSRGPSPIFEEPAALVPAGWGWLFFALPGAAVLGAVIATLFRHRSELWGTSAPGRTPGEDAAPLQALLLVGAVQLGLFALVGGGGDRWPARYLVPLWPALSILFGIAVARWRPRRQALALLVALPASYTLLVDPSWPRAGDREAALAEATAVARAVEESGAEAVWAEYWDTYRLALLAGTDIPWLALRVIERRPDWARAAETASPAAYLVREGDGEMLAILAAAPSRGIEVLEEREVGRFRMVVTRRPVPGAVLMNPVPPRGWQMLAALGAGLLFVGTMIGVGSLPRILAHARRRRTG